MRSAVRLLVGTIGLLSLPARAQLLGTPFRVNTVTSASQRDPTVTFDGAGNAVIVWAGGDINSTYILGQRFDAGFNPIGGEFRVSASTVPTDGWPPSVAAFASGSFVVVWGGYGQEILAQRFDAAGALVGGEFRINTATTAILTNPRVASDPSGAFMVAWESGGFSPYVVIARRFTSSGAPSGAEFRVDTYAAGRSSRPRIAGSSSGFIVVWSNDTEDGSSAGVFAQRFTSSGGLVGGAFQVNSATLKQQYEPSVAFDGGGGFVVAWSSYQPGSGLSYQIHAQRFTSSGGMLGPETEISTHTAALQGFSSVARGAGRGYLVVWSEKNILDGRGRFFSGTGEESPPELALPASGGELAGDGAGNFVVVYAGPDGNLSGIFAQRLTEPPQPLAPETKVSAATTNTFQFFPRVAQDSAGGFVVVWTRYETIVDFSVAGRRFDAAGNAIGAEFRVNSITPGNQGPADVAPLPGGGFVAAWVDYGGNEGAGDGLFARRFDASGIALGADFRVNAATTGNQLHPSVASASQAGTFVVAWAGPDGDTYGVFARRFSSAGAALGGDLRVSTYSTGKQQHPSVASDGAGNFVVAWESAGQDGSGYGVYMRRFDSAGAPLTGDLLSSSVTIGDQRSPRVAMDDSGDFVLVFTSTGVDGNGTAVRAQRYSSSGAALGGQFTVNTFTTGDQTAPDVSMDTAGFVVVWHSPGDGAVNGVFGQRYKKTGERIGVEFQVNTYTTGDQTVPAVVLGRNLVVAWQNGAFAPAGGIYARVFGNPCGGDWNGDGTVDVADVFFLINYLFAGGPAPDCAGDVSGDGILDIADVFYLINYLFAGGPPPL